jgi:signal transduction histidine kinase
MRSLRWLLVRRLVALQAALLAATLGLILGLLWANGMLLSLESEDDVIAAVQEAVGRDADGALMLRPSAALSAIEAAEPGLWFSLRDRGGRRLEHGVVPPEFARIGAALDGVSQARLGWQQGDPPRAPGRMQWIRTPAGDIQVLTGPGPAVPATRVVKAGLLVLASIILPILVIMALATMVATPLVVRRALAGLGAIAAQAGRIDIGRPGPRLADPGMPAEIAPLVTAFNAALDRLDDGYARHKRFLADAAHELRTPIAILATRLDSLDPGPGQTRLAADVARLSLMAEQLLDLQRLDRRAARFAPVDLVALGRRVAADLAPLAIASGYAVAFDAGVPAVTVDGDEAAIERAITNLVQNAIEHGGGRGTIGLAVAAPGVVEVTDDGDGIPIELRDRIFEPFHRAVPRMRGAGLGLHLVREVASLHGGSVTVIDRPGGGTCFRLSFGTA